MTVPYDIRFTREAVKDVQVLTPKLKAKLKTVLEQVVAINPTAGKALAGDLKGFYSYRLTILERILYTVSEDEHTVYIHRARTHYGD